MQNENLMIKDISTDEFITILSEYYSEILHQDIKVKYNVRIIWNDNLSLNVFFEKRSYGDRRTINLTDEDIKKCLEVHANALGYTLNNYKYIGGIRHVGYFTEENAPHFEGVRLYLKEKCKTKIKK